MKKSQLEIKVLAVNILNEYAQRVYDYEKKHFSQFIGKDIFKVDGSLKAKYEHEKITFPGRLTDGTHLTVTYWFSRNSRYFDIHIKICVNGGSYDVKPSTAFCQYEEMQPTLFEIETVPTRDPNKVGLGYTLDVLKETTQQLPDFSVRYDVPALLDKAARIQEAAALYEQVSSGLPYQFTEVLNVKRLTSR